MSNNIFNIQQDKLILEDRLEELLMLHDGEITEEIEEEVSYLLSELGFNKENFLEKVDSTVYFIKKLEGDVGIIKSEIDRLTKLKKSKETAIERNKTNLVNAMITFDHEKLDRTLYKLSLRTSYPAPIIYGEIPEEFVSIVIEEKEVVDNKAVKDFLQKNGPQEWGEPSVKRNLQIK